MILLDAVTTTGQLSGTSFSFNHTVSGYNRLLIVGFWAHVSDALTSITCNGVAMTLIGKVQTPGDRWVYLYAKKNPDLGVNTIAYTFSTSVLSRHIAISYKNAHQVTQPDASTTTTATAQTSVTPTLTSIADKCWTVFVTKNTNGADPAAGTGTTRRGNTGNLGLFDSNGDITPAGSTSLQATGSSGNWGAVMASITPSPKEVPIISDDVATGIQTAQATGQGNVLYDGTDTITERGFVWSTSANPTTADNKVVVAGTTGAYTGAMTGLTPSTGYHYRSYATNSTGTSYGADQIFTTLDLTAPIIVTYNAKYKNDTNVTGSGEVTYDGGTPITQRGFVVGTSVNPTTSNTKYIVEGKSGRYDGIINNLIKNTTYHYRAYAINAIGTSYGADKTFKAAFFDSDFFGINIGQEFQSGLNNFDGYTDATTISPQLDQLIRGDIRELKKLGFRRFRFASPGIDWAERLIYMKKILDIIASEGDLHLEWGVMPNNSPEHYAEWIDAVNGHAQDFQTIINRYASIGVTGGWICGNELENGGSSTVSNITRASNVVTITCPFRHALNAGWKIRVTGSSVLSTNNYTIASIVDDYRFTIASSGSDGSQNGGSITYADMNVESTMRNQVRKVAANLKGLSNPSIDMDLSYSCVQNKAVGFQYRPFYWSDAQEGRGQLRYLDLNIYGVGSNDPEANWLAFKAQVDEIYNDIGPANARITEWATHFNDTTRPAMNNNLAARTEMLLRKRAYMELLGFKHYFFAYRMPAILAEKVPAYNNRNGGTRPSLYILTGNRSPYVEIEQDL